MLASKLRSVLAHLGLVVCSVAYVCIGAFIFLRIERPNELLQRRTHHANYEALKMEFITRSSLENLTRLDLARLVDEYICNMFEFFDDPQAAIIFESEFMDYGMAVDQWTPASSFLFAATTVIPVGYGFVTPTTKIGRLLIIIYGLIGAPLVLVTVTDVGKFISFYSTKFLPSSMSGICFLTFLLIYLFVGAMFFSLFSPLTYLHAVYFSITSVFTIGFGDTPPPVPVPYLILFIILGVILVTITVELVAAEAINQIHYMGRHVGKAKEIASRMLQLAQSLNMNRGVSLGLTQIESLKRLNFDKRASMTGKYWRKGRPSTAFEPVISDDLEFMDVAASDFDTHSTH
ncbi:TWiK family of potassium channels protein 7 [Toxocara canis]|uniref:TWiK family of potassium channels protein 7 n=2 Tax=Toxocara canis TaxID=6265 RepID=A0A0B2UQC8_TOXCA|nr:TWiK family of potassium channels protein 7 [Toxocara canis]